MAPTEKDRRDVRRIEIDPHVLLWLKCGENRSSSEGVRTRLVQVVDMDVEVDHHLLLDAAARRPRRPPVARLGLEGEAGSAFG